MARYDDGMIPMEEGRNGPEAYAPKHGYPSAVSSPTNTAYHGQNTYNYNSGMTSPGPVPPYGSYAPPIQHQPDPQYSNQGGFTDKPALVPVVASNNGGMGMGIPPAEKRICGIRRKVFFIILAVVVLLALGGLGAGLGIALTKKNSSSGNSDNGRAGPDSSGSSYMAPTRTTPYTSPSTPYTPPSTPTTPATSEFTLETGYNTMVVTITSTSGDSNLCSLLLGVVSATTTIYPSIVADGDSYNAYWTLSGNTGTLSATGVPPEATEDPKLWFFRAETGSTAGGCSQDGADGLALADNGLAIYSSGFTFRSQCTIASQVFGVGDSCYVYWIGDFTS